MADRKVFADSIAQLPAAEGLTPNGLMLAKAEPEDRNEKMTVHFKLSMPPKDEADLEARVARGEVVATKELKTRYAPKAPDVTALVSWLKKQGFTVEDAGADPTSVYAEATAGQIEKALDVNMVRVTKDGVTYTSASTAPSLPTDVGNPVQAIGGLQPFLQFRKHSVKMLRTEGNRVALSSNGVLSPSPNIANAPPYLIHEISKAYAANTIGSGTGQSIAILIDTFPLNTDITKFWSANSVVNSMANIQKINVPGGALPPPSGEETLDVSWASGIAPQAKIRVYASGALSFVALDKALDRIIADAAKIKGLRQLSISLGLGETFMPAGEFAIEHAKFLRLAAMGVNVFVSSGDAGSNPDATGHGSHGPLQVEYFSSDTCVIGVGGTSLKLAPTGLPSSETGWPGSGGGKSVKFTKQPWQVGSGVPAGNQRCVPDVSLAADPNRGAFLVLNGHTIQIGGTSWSAPVWAAFCALMNSARQSAGKPMLPFLNPLLYPRLGTAAFRDITAGSNGAYSAGPGYDMVTGIGVPNVARLHASIP